MARQKNNGKGSDLSLLFGAWARWFLVRLVILAIVLAPMIWGYCRVRGYVERELSYPAGTPTVVLKEGTRPAWMDDTLAQHIIRMVQPSSISSSMDKTVLERIGVALGQNAWIKRVKQVRRVYRHSAGDTIEVDCEYRTPTALVLRRNKPPLSDEYIMVDAEGVRLPEKFSATKLPPVMFSADGRVTLRILEGIAAAAPEKAGQKWVGEDVQAGLDMARFLLNRNCTEEIFRINMRNFGGREKSYEPQIVLITRYGTNIRWGEPVGAKFQAEIPPTQKLGRLARFVQEYGRVDADRPWVDIRMDQITYPEEAAPVVQAGDGGGRGR